MANQQVVLITGASSGFGRLIAEQFAAAGAIVFAGMRDPAGANAAARERCEALASAGQSIEALTLDVTSDAEVEAAVAHAIASHGHIDVLINNAGVSMSGLSECSTLAQAQWIFDVNYFGPLRMCRAVLPHMRKRGAGFVIHMSSIAGRVSLPNAAHYAGSKAALEVLGEVQRYELAGFGVDVALVEPGVYATGLLDKVPYADDVARTIEYGAIGEKPAQGLAIAQQMTANGSPDPQEVVDVVMRLVQTPAGQRPLRSLVGQDAAMLEPINAVTGPLAEAMFKAFGFL